MNYMSWKCQGLFWSLSISRLCGFATLQGLTPQYMYWSIDVLNIYSDRSGQSYLLIITEHSFMSEHIDDKSVKRHQTRVVGPKYYSNQWAGLFTAASRVGTLWGLRPLATVKFYYQIKREKTLKSRLYLWTQNIVFSLGHLVSLWFTTRETSWNWHQPVSRGDTSKC